MTIKHFARLGFEGLDVNLATSLFEYGIIWRVIRRHHKKHREDPRNYPVGEVEIVAPCLRRRGYYHYSWYSANTDMKKEFSWIKDWTGFLRFAGCPTFEEWDALSLPHKIADLIRYYGQIEILGDDYGRGFPVKET